MKLYVDLDSVLTDFLKAVSDLMGTKLERGKALPDSRDMWIKINRAGEKFWTGMDWEPGGRDLWEAVKGYHPTILSSPTRHPSSKAGKAQWVRENLGEDVPLILDSHKDKYAEPDAVLIDDRRKNIDKWEAAGGVGILHKNAEETIRRVREVMSREKDAYKMEYVADPLDPSRKVGIERLRGGRRTKVHKDDTAYDRKKEKDWRRHTVDGSLRVVLAYLSQEASITVMQEIANDFEQEIAGLKGVYEAIKKFDPEGAAQFDAVHKIESAFYDADYKVEKIRHGDRDEIGRLDYGLKALKTSLRGHPESRRLLDKRAYDDFKFRAHPVVIDPYDAIVQQAIQQMGPAGRNIDVVKLELTCPGKRVAWVTNEDFFEGKKDRKRVVHLCLNKIKDDFKKSHGKAFNMASAEDAKRMREVVVSYLRDVVLPHEEAHIEQEVKGEGKFGPSPEVGAERSEEWGGMEQLGIRKRASSVVHAYLDGMAGKTPAWTHESAERLLAGLKDLWPRYGYKQPKIVGSVAKKGRSDHDLDILMDPVDPEGEFDFEGLWHALEKKLHATGEFTYEMETFELQLPNGRIIDMFFSEKGKA